MDAPPPRPRGPPPKKTSAVPGLSPPSSPPPPRGPRAAPPRGSGPENALKPPPGIPPPARPIIMGSGVKPQPRGPGIPPPLSPAPSKPTASGSGSATGMPPRPSGSPPIPRGAPPVPGGLPPRPSGSPPVPGGLPPRPGGLPPRPTGSPPVPGGLPPRPGGSPPAPRPSGSPPIPSGLPPRPTGSPPVPSGSTPKPTGSPPTPGGAHPRPTGLPPTPSSSPPRPSGSPPVPSGSPPKPGGLPPRPGASPPTSSPPRPGGLPPRPGGLPPARNGAPPRPAGLPPKPSGVPPRPAEDPPTPAKILPPKPTGAPIKPSSPPPQSGSPELVSSSGKVVAPPSGPPPPSAAMTGTGSTSPVARRKPAPPAAPPPAEIKPPIEEEDEEVPPPPEIAPPLRPPPPSEPQIIEEVVPPPPDEEEEEENPAVDEEVDHAPPPGDIDPEFEDRPPELEDDYDINKAPEALPRLLPGRYIINIVKGFKLSKHDASSAINATKIDPYVVLTMGKQKKAPSQKAPVHKNQGKDVDFNDTLVFDVTDPEKYVVNNDFILHVSIMNHNILSDSVLGEADISLLPLLKVFHKQSDYALYYKKKKKDTPEPSGFVTLDIKFRPAKSGYLVVNCCEGKNMKNMELIGKQDPYCHFALGNQKPIKTKTIKNGGTDCSFNEEEVRIWVDSEAWVDYLIFSCYDEDVGSDDLIGSHPFNLLDFMTEATTIEEFEAEGMGKSFDEFYDIFQGKNLDKLSGKVRLKIQFYPAGTLTIHTIEARHLVDKDTMGKQDPYAIFMSSSDRGTANFKLRTKTDTDGGTDPRWDEKLTMSIVDHHELCMELYDEDRIGSDDMIGKASFSLLPVFKKGVIDAWITIRNKDSWGRVTKCGEVHLNLDFYGPPGVPYPLLQPDMDSFDETLRENKKVEEVPQEEPSIDANEVPLSSEFTMEEIETAFRYIDLNKNNFIGAGEIRHMLIGMGELITDEEVDEMIRMVDGDGDGQVSFEEFYAMMVHPDPSSLSFDPKAILKNTGTDVALGVESKDLIEQRRRDAATREEKMKLMKIFASSNEVTLALLQRSYENFKLIDRGQGNTGLVDFSTMCEILLVEPVGEYKKMFKILDSQQKGLINMRELLMGLSNFVGASKEARTNFCFTIFDEDGSGTLDQGELVQILKANHLVTDESSVKRKAETIMKQCDEDGSGEISREEFLLVSRKFPNILFPEFLEE